MKWINLVLLGLALLVTVTACEPEAPIPVEQPPPQVVELQITPAVEHWLPWVAGCAADIPNFGVSVRVLPRAELSLAETDLILRLGERLETDPFVAVMGVEEIVIVAGEDVPVDSIRLADLQAIYAGTITHWGEVLWEGEIESEKGQPLKPLSYPEGHEVQVLFTRVYLDDNSSAIEPQVFSTTAFLEKLLDLHPYTISYLLESQVPEGVRILSVSPEDQVASLQYVLAITAEEPTGGLKQLLLCLQNVQ